MSSPHSLQPPNPLLPNFIYVGPDKAGSTWLYKVLEAHPSAYVPPVKDIFFFDRYYHRGLAWYAKFYAKARPSHTIRADISHDYLFSPTAALRIAEHLPHAKLMVCVREPVDRAMSAYRYMIRQGRIKQMDFLHAIKSIPELLDHGCYARHLQPFLAHFPRHQIHIAIFDHLRNDPSAFADSLFAYLSLPPIKLPPYLSQPVLPASEPRIFLLARLAKRAALRLRDLGHPLLVQRIKDSRLVQTSLYRSPRSRLTIDHQTLSNLKQSLRPEVLALSELTGIDFLQLWGY